MKDIVDGILEDDRFGFEEVTYLLLFGDMPNEEQLKDLRSFSFSTEPFLSTLFVMLSSRPQVTI